METIAATQDDEWDRNTDFVAVFERLVLLVAVAEKLRPEDMAGRVFVLSDMQFDRAIGGAERWSTSCARARRRFEEAGCDVPELVFWNLAGGRAGFGQKNDDDEDDGDDKTVPKPGTALVSGTVRGSLRCSSRMVSLTEVSRRTKRRVRLLWIR